MRILLVAATRLEIAPLLGAGAQPAGLPLRFGAHDVDVVETGVGMVATAVHCAGALARAGYDLALNVGVCGSFDPALRPGTIVHVVADCLAELGAEDGERFLTIHQLGLVDADAHPLTGGMLVNASPPASAALARLPAVRGITVNTVHGHEPSIAAARERFAPQVESMEGAAFMYACLVSGVPFAQVRAVSNMVERRNRAAWKLPDAVAALSAATTDILESL